jgi:prepilin-type N-terminal cleavage/methylation domain-containing protein
MTITLDWFSPVKRLRQSRALLSRHQYPAAFTLIELLVVISIIAVLAGLLLPVVSSVMVNAQKVQAKDTEMQVVAAVKNFETEYGVYPLPTDSPTGVDICFGAQHPTNAELFDILRADNQGTEATINPRAIVYIELPNAKNQAPGKSKSGIGSDGMLYDPWGTIYLIGVDANYDGVINNPYSKNAGSNPLRTAVIVYSWGPDTLTTSNFYGGGDKNDPQSVDDVISWQ